MPEAKKVKRVRDITACLSLAALALVDAQAIRSHADDGEYSPETNDRVVENLTALITKLRTLNASTGKREKGKGPALTPVAASGAKKGGGRRR